MASLNDMGCDVTAPHLTQPFTTTLSGSVSDVTSDHVLLCDVIVHLLQNGCHVTARNVV